MFDVELTDFAKVLYAYLLDLRDVSKKNQKEYIFPKIQTIAKKMNKNRRTVERNLQALERKGLVRVERKNGTSSKIFFPETYDKNVAGPTTSMSQPPTTKMSQVSNESNKRNQSISNQGKRRAPRLWGEHTPSYDSAAFEEKAKHVPIYKPKEGA